MNRLTNHFDYCDLMDCQYRNNRLKEKNQCEFFNVSSMDKCHDKKIYEKLREYEDLEEQGLLLKLPCKVGERVYTVSFNYECECDYDCVEIDNFKCEEGIPCEHMVLSYYVKETSFCIPMIDVLGKRVFRTKEEAEKALAEMGEEI